LHRDAESDSELCGRRLETVPAVELKLVDWLTNRRSTATETALVTGPVGFTAAERTDCAEEPAALLALTLNVYVEPYDSPQMRMGDTVPVAVTSAAVPFHAVTVNDVARASAGRKET